MTTKATGMNDGSNENEIPFMTTTGNRIELLPEHPAANPGEGETILWAIDPGSLSRVFNDSAIAAADGDVNRAAYHDVTEDGIAIFRMIGPIGRRMSGFARWMFDGVDSDAVGAELLEAAANPAIKSIILHIDSPGGTVAGTKELADIVAGIEKPVVAFSDGQMLSAAYWIGSAADRIVGTPTAMFGSIGVIATHVDRSRMLERIGLKVTHIFNGAFKAIGSDVEPLSEAGREYIQNRVNEIYSVFVADVAPARGMTPDSIRGLESATFIGEKAKGQGLIDEVSSLVKTYTKTKREIGIMDVKELKTDFSAVYEEVIEIGRGSITKADAEKMFPEIAGDARAEGEKAGAEAERTRIAEIREAAFNGQGALVETLIKDGVSADDARKAILADQKSKAKQGLEDLANGDVGDLGENLGGDSASGGDSVTAKDKVEAGNKLTEIANSHVRARGIPFGQAFVTACAEHPSLAAMYEGK